MDSLVRKPVRPVMADNKGNVAPRGNSAPPQKKQVPPDQTHAENFYYIKQMQAKTPMVVILKDGEKLEGVIEWYDKSCLKINRDEGPNLLVYKHHIKYMYKAEEAD